MKEGHWRTRKLCSGAGALYHSLDSVALNGQADWVANEVRMMKDTDKTNSRFIKEIKRLKPHDHLCHIYAMPEEWSAAVTAFLVIGLKQAILAPSQHHLPLNGCNYIPYAHEFIAIFGY